MFQLAKSFGFASPPNIDLAFEYKRSSQKKIERRSKEGYYGGQESDGEF